VVVQVGEEVEEECTRTTIGEEGIQAKVVEVSGIMLEADSGIEIM